MNEAVAAGFDLTAFLEADRRAVEAGRRRVSDLLLGAVPAGLAEPVRYALEAGGKRLRPILCVAAYRAAMGRAAGGAEPDGDRVPSAVYDLACAVELVHTYSLVHDDLPCMDDDDLRRGLPTTHRVFGEPRAVLAGAALIPLACLALDHAARELGLDPSERARLVGVLCAAAGAEGMVGGQLLDLEAERREIGLDELETIHHRKTGTLLAAALRLGGLAARAAAPVLTALSAYGRAIGLAFQIADDILDVTGTTAALGKTAGRDVDLAKATYPALLGLGGARTRAWSEARSAVSSLRRAGIDSPELEALAAYAVEREQ